MKGIFETIPQDSQLRKYGKFLIVNRNGYVPVKADTPTDVEYFTDKDMAELEELTGEGLK